MTFAGSCAADIGRDSAFVIYQDDSVAAGHLGEPPYQNPPGTILAAFRPLKLGPLHPRVVRGHCLARDLQNSGLINPFRLICGWRSNCAAVVLIAGTTGSETESDEQEH
jgi:hypothetical protein